MRDKTFTMSLPSSFVENLSKRYNGRELPEEKIKLFKGKIDLFYSQYLKASNSLKRLWKFWKEKNVEGHYMETIWYNAHSRRKRYVKAKLEAHRSLFYTLLNADGNHKSFNENFCISAKEIKENFYVKYIKEENKGDTK